MRRHFGDHDHNSAAHRPAAQSLSTTPERYSTTRSESRPTTRWTTTACLAHPRYLPQTAAIRQGPPPQPLREPGQPLGLEGDRSVQADGRVLDIQKSTLTSLVLGAPAQDGWGALASEQTADEPGLPNGLRDDARWSQASQFVPAIQPSSRSARSRSRRAGTRRTSPPTWP